MKFGQRKPRPNHRDPIVDLVQQDLTDRKALGISKYGTPLQAFNGRSALLDAYEEVLDLACYLRQLLEEVGSAPIIFTEDIEA